MKSLIQVVAVSAALVVPALSFAQSDAPATRAQVNADLVQYEQTQQSVAHVSGRDPYYPASAQAVAAREDQSNGTSAYGGVANSTVASGKLVRIGDESDKGTVYFGR
jgi:hypothetical protein